MSELADRLPVAQRVVRAMHPAPVDLLAHHHLDDAELTSPQQPVEALGHAGVCGKWADPREGLAGDQHRAG
jgi:hypothetical protein